ncbi:MarR family winged helix-turn-helix transcriptional regulator [Streptomyces sp. NPDC001595]|uniref:MarR family winged helix-turn-helix transcriptional regulator n=1 Tax=Streptomyces sp. NPDC001532 TaxID=3154520 RepID=UPI00331B2C1A
MLTGRHHPPPEPRLGRLLEQARAKLARASAEALAAQGVDHHELAVLGVFAAGEELSQAEAAGRLGVDRTTTAALLDGLEDQGLVERRRDPRDRRRNIVEPTPRGRDCLLRAEAARRAAEHRFLAPLDAETASTLVRALRLRSRRTPSPPSDSGITCRDEPAGPHLRCRYAGERRSETLVLLCLSPRGTPPQGGRHLVRVAEWQTR